MSIAILLPRFRDIAGFLLKTDTQPSLFDAKFGGRLVQLDG